MLSVLLAFWKGIQKPRMDFSHNEAEIWSFGVVFDVSREQAVEQTVRRHNSHVMPL